MIYNLISRKKVRKTEIFTETFALVGGSVNEYFGADDVSEGQEHLHELRITKLLGKVIDKEITALGTGDGASWKRRKKSIPHILDIISVANCLKLKIAKILENTPNNPIAIKE